MHWFHYDLEKVRDAARKGLKKESNLVPDAKMGGVR